MMRIPMPITTELNVRVIPNASRDEIVGWHAGALKIKTAVAPESGKANKAICALLAKHLGLPKRAVSVLRGQTNSQKCLLVTGLSEAELRERLGG
ncbi:Unannotated [Lentimonas sp. CC4]|nr:Unannotated [Lentimonas sp. CC4]CAA6683635.1 Unannotated [Lentimonas sp. CC6]CAA7074519.1 Unannotated [Lentimonas sp. CC4]CAA7169132.1 Unannotated [Lentimonas sp. CC21]CAA7180464.1 Unannotated [Lentimonas sp. CC8]